MWAGGERQSEGTRDVGTEWRREGNLVFRQLCFSQDWGRGHPGTMAARGLWPGARDTSPSAPGPPYLSEGEGDGASRAPQDAERRVHCRGEPPGPEFQDPEGAPQWTHPLDARPQDTPTLKLTPPKPAAPAPGSDTAAGP